MITMILSADSNCILHTYIAEDLKRLTEANVDVKHKQAVQRLKWTTKSVCWLFRKKLERRTDTYEVCGNSYLEFCSSATPPLPLLPQPLRHGRRSYTPCTRASLRRTTLTALSTSPVPIVDPGHARGGWTPAVEQSSLFSYREEHRRQRCGHVTELIGGALGRRPSWRPLHPAGVAAAAGADGNFHRTMARVAAAGFPSPRLFQVVSPSSEKK
jgi:hypothetical protein